MVNKDRSTFIPFCSWYTMIKMYKTKSMANNLAYNNDLTKKIGWLQVLRNIDTFVSPLQLGQVSGPIFSKS